MGSQLRYRGSCYKKVTKQGLSDRAFDVGLHRINRDQLSTYVHAGSTVFTPSAAVSSGTTATQVKVTSYMQTPQGDFVQHKTTIRKQQPGEDEVDDAYLNINANVDSDGKDIFTYGSDFLQMLHENGIDRDNLIKTGVETSCNFENLNPFNGTAW